MGRDFWGTLYIATDNGVFVSYNQGEYWETLGNGLPTVPVTDLNLHTPTRTLLAATYGRSQYLIHLREASGTSVVKQLDENMRVFPNPSTDQVTIQFELQ